MSDRSRGARVICLGTAVHDLVFAVATLPTGPGKHRAGGLAQAGGGMAASAAAAIARLGTPVELWTRLGDDPLGDQICAELQGYGVDMRWTRRCPGRRSALSAVLVDATGERLVVNYTDPDLPEATDTMALARVAGAGAVLVDPRWPQGALALVEQARRHGVPALLDADAAPVPRSLVEAASHCVFSAEALHDFAGTADPESGLRVVTATTSALVAVTCGAAGAYWLERGTLYHQPAFAVTTVDTLGAGDVFHGALAAALAELLPLAAAMRFAAAAAALKCTRFGGRAGAPTRAEVEALLATGA